MPQSGQTTATTRRAAISRSASSPTTKDADRLRLRKCGNRKGTRTKIGSGKDGSLPPAQTQTVRSGGHSGGTLTSALIVPTPRPQVRLASTQSTTRGHASPVRLDRVGQARTRPAQAQRVSNPDRHLGGATLQHRNGPPASHTHGAAGMTGKEGGTRQGPRCIGTAPCRSGKGRGGEGFRSGGRKPATPISMCLAHVVFPVRSGGSRGERVPVRKWLAGKYLQLRIACHCSCG